MTTGHASAFSPRIAPEFCKSIGPKKKGRRKRRVPTALAARAHWTQQLNLLCKKIVPLAATHLRSSAMQHRCSNRARVNDREEMFLSNGNFLRHVEKRKQRRRWLL
jgi:hypothetical protein